ncbi:MAG: alkaline phosphatase family protein [Gemmatimonadaceae bacterium]
MLHTFHLRKSLELLARLIVVTVAVFSAAVAASLLVDRVNPPAMVVDPGVASVDTTNHARLLILHIDSWRYETAIDSTFMPQVARLRKQGASWQLETVFEGFTIPAVRAAFSGREETQLVNLVQNFSFHALPIGSFFLDASRLGKHTLVVAQEPWVQFGPYFEQRVPARNGSDMYALDHERPAMALNAFRDEKFDIVVCHYESADWVAHETGIHSERYRHEFAYADSLVAAFAAARQPNDYLLVYGDHGHSPLGEHKTGISIPTFGLLLGPDVKPGVVVGPLAMTNLRYIVSHAIGITLRSAPYDTRSLAQFLPIVADSAVVNRSAVQHASTNVSDYLLAIVVALCAAVLGWSLVRLVGGADISATVFFTIFVPFAVEVSLQQRIAPTISLFPLLIVGLGLAATQQGWQSRLAIVAIGLWFVTRLMGADFSGSGLVGAPTELRALIPLYVIAIAAKFLVLLGRSASTPTSESSVAQSSFAGTFTTHLRNAPWRSALVCTAVLALLEFRVWDHAAACGIVLLAGLIALWTTENASSRRMALIVILQSLIYFTLRLPLYQLAWIDLFFAALFLIARRRDDAWVDALIITGAFTLTCGWLASSLEWSFLYSIFPAHLVELQVQYFLPFILAKIPLVFLLAFVVIGRTPTRRVAKLLFAYTALRFGSAWILRLTGASGANLWPLAEQGMYLATFVIAAITWGWQVRAEKFKPASHQPSALVPS